ncbi:MAG: barstar family protein [Lachnospiraceae bacterium]
MKTFTIDGNNFSDLEGFYDEIDKILTKDLEWKTGHNLDAYNDLLRGGFGVHDEEPIVLKWLNYKKSKRELGDKLILSILEITLDCNNSGHDCKLELY